jgi:hypothetical protein
MLKTEGTPMRSISPWQRPMLTDRRRIAAAPRTYGGAAKSLNPKVSGELLNGYTNSPLNSAQEKSGSVTFITESGPERV